MSATDSNSVIAVENKRFHTFIFIAFVLVILTGIELIVIFPPFPSWFVYATLIILSLFKFIFVILWFMHLIYDRQLLFWLFISGMILATGTITALLLLLSAEDVDKDAWSYHSEPVAVQQVMVG